MKKWCSITAAFNGLCLSWLLFLHASCWAGVCSEAVHSCRSEISFLSLVWIRTRDISLYWTDEGGVKYLTIETISLFTSCSFPPWSSESWSIPFNVGSSVSPCCFSAGFPPCWAVGCRDSHMTALMLRKYQECGTQCGQISAFLAALLPGYESLGPLLSLCFHWNSSIPLQLGG